MTLSSKCLCAGILVIFALANAAPIAQVLKDPPEKPADVKPDRQPSENRIVAWVGRQVITSDAVREKYGARLMAVEPERREDVFAAGLIALVEDTAILQDAERIGLAVTPKIVKDYIDRQFKSDREYEEELNQRGISGERFEADIGHDLVRNTYIGARASVRSLGPGLRSPHVLEPRIQDLRESYLKRKAEFRVKGRAKIRLITISRSGIARSENLPDAAAFEAWLKKLEQDLKTGADFGLLAKRYDASPDEEERGVEEWIDEQSTYLPEIVKAAFESPVGQVAGPIRPEGGGLSFFVEIRERDEARQIPFSEVLPKLREESIQRAREIAVLLEQFAVLEQAFIRPAGIRALVLERKRQQIRAASER